MNYRLLFSILFFSLVISSCGGGGSPDQAPIRTKPDEPTPTTTSTPESSSSISWNKVNCPGITTSKVGVNQSNGKYWSGQIYFANLMKHSKGWQRPFGSPNANRALQLDIDGYPTRIDLDSSFITIIHDDAWGRDIEKDDVYVLLYDGEGDFTLQINHTIVEQRPGRIVYKIQGKGRTILQLNSTNPNNHARNMSYVALSDETTFKAQPFRKEFLDTWGSFPTVRYMDWLATNNSTLTTWNQRTTKTNMVQVSEFGIAYEYIIQLSNYTKTNPWITIPHRADNNYVRQLATLFKNTLDPDLTVYVEYTNEAWNSIFDQTKFIEAEGLKVGLNSRNYYSQRTAEIMDIWTSIYLGESKKRYVRIIGTQFTNTTATNQIVSFGNVFEHVDALAVGAYFGGPMGRNQEAAKTLTMSPSAIVQQLLVTELPKVKANMRSQKQIADTYNLRLVAYEGGQHLVGSGTHPTLGNLSNNQKLTDLFIAANREPKMKDAYLQYLNDWNQISGDLMLLFDSVRIPNRYGSWGLLEFGSQAIQNSPKASGVKQYLCDTK